MADELNLPACFQYINSTGDEVVKASQEDYLKMVGTKVCSLNSQVATHSNLLAKLVSSVNTLNAKPDPSLALPEFYSLGLTTPTTLLSLVDYVKLLETSILNLRAGTGTPEELFSAIAAAPIDIDTAKALGTSGGLLKTLPGWVQTVTTGAASLQNLWIAFMDLRSAVRNIQLTCCSTSCDGVAVVLQTTLSGKILKLYFTGSIPANLISCSTEGAMFKIADNSGNHVNYFINVHANLNTSSGVTYDLTGTPLNFADDLKISGVFALCDTDNGTRCEKYIEQTVNNTTPCPAVTLVNSYTSIDYTFVHVDGSVTYSVQLFNEVNVMIQSINTSVVTPQVMSGTFDNLEMGTNYKVRVQIITLASTKTCPFTLVSTLENPCSAPEEATATID